MRRMVFVGVATTMLITLITPVHGSEQNRPDPAVAQLPVTTLTVSAAASLTDVFPVIAQAFSTRYPNITIRFNFAGSNALVEQLRAGAPVDVIATASEPTMRTAVINGWAARPWLFAKNSLVIATPRGNPARIRTVQDLTRSGIQVAICAPAVPCGTAANQLFTKNDITVRPVTRELDVRAVLGKVIADQVDAGIVYATDARSAGKNVTTVRIPAADNVTVTYPIATVRYAKHQVAANAFVHYVRFSPSAQRILRAWGFERAW
jgi:molybdate transport system substrate-binding protein